MAVDASRRTGRLPRLGGLDPAGATLLVDHPCQRGRGALRLGQRPDAACAQLRPQSAENSRGGDRIAQCGMAARNLDVEPCGEIFQRIVGEIRLGDLGEESDVE